MEKSKYINIIEKLSEKRSLLNKKRIFTIAKIPKIPKILDNNNNTIVSEENSLMYNKANPNFSHELRSNRLTEQNNNLILYTNKPNEININNKDNKDYASNLNINFSELPNYEKQVKNNSKKQLNRFTEYEKSKITQLKDTFPQSTWKQLSYHLPNKSTDQIRKHWVCSLNPNIKKGKWSQHEDNIVIDYIKKNGIENISNCKVNNRTNKQIRERWENYLKLQIINNNKFIWNKENEDLLLKLFLKFNTNWKIIANTIIETFGVQISTNAIKNKFYSLMRMEVNRYTKDNIKVKNEFISKKETNYVKIQKEVDGFFNSSSYIEKNSDDDDEDDNSKSEDNNKASDTRSYRKYKKREFLCKDELLKYLPLILKLRNISIKDIQEDFININSNISSKGIYDSNDANISKNSDVWCDSYREKYNCLYSNDNSNSNNNDNCIGFNINNTCTGNYNAKNTLVNNGSINIYVNNIINHKEDNISSNITLAKKDTNAHANTYFNNECLLGKKRIKENISLENSLKYIENIENNNIEREIPKLSSHKNSDLSEFLNPCNTEMKKNNSSYSLNDLNILDLILLNNSSNNTQLSFTSTNIFNTNNKLYSSNGNHNNQYYNTNNNSNNNLNLNYSLFELEDKQLTSNLSKLSNNNSSIINNNIENKRKIALRKVIESINKKKIEIRRNELVNNLKSGILLSLQVDILNKIVLRIKANALENIFKSFKMRINLKSNVNNDILHTKNNQLYGNNSNMEYKDNKEYKDYKNINDIKDVRLN